MGQSMNRPCTRRARQHPLVEDMDAMRYLNPIFLFLVIVGGLNWLLVGVAKFDLVAALTGQTFGETSPVSSLIYILVGVSAIGLIPTLIRWVARPAEPALA